MAEELATEEINPQEALTNRQPDGTFGPGNLANPGGRPRGSISLKEYIRRKLLTMNDEEKDAYLRSIDKALQWQMGEGKPQSDVNLGGEIGVKVYKWKEKKSNSITNPEPGV
jgi:hypothetical protein